MPDEPLKLPDDPTIGLLLKFAHRLAHQHYSAALESYKLTPAHIEILRLLAQQPTCLVGVLAEKCWVTPPVMSALIDTLVERDLVARQTDPTDRRRHCLALTTHGRQLLAELLTVRQKVNDEIVATLTADEEVVMMLGLRKIIARLAAIEPTHDALPSPQ